MKIEVELNKRFIITTVVIALILIGLVGVIAYNSAGVPSTFGHSVNEIEWSQNITNNVSAVGFCIVNATGKYCTTSWGGGQWGTSGTNIYYNTGNVSIGTASFTGAKLEVAGGPIKATGGLIIETRTSDPSPPALGQIWLRTDL